MRKHCTILVLIMAIILQSFADRSVQVFSRDEGFAEGNISKPRIYIKNTGDDTLTFLRYYYYFTTEESKQPVFDDYYSPDVNIAIEHLHDSLYRVKYEFDGNIFPGAMYPSEVENVIGLHYPNWSPWNKENDYSKSFGTYINILNENIPVYDENETLLFGIEPPDTGNGGTPPPPPPPGNDTLVVLPASTFPMGYYAVYGVESVNIADSVTIKNGKIGSNTYIEVGCDALLQGDIVAGGNLFLRERASVKGSVQIAGIVSRQNGTSVSGSETDSMHYEPVQLPVVSVTPGVVNKIIPVNQSETIYPGAYDTLIAYAGATVTLRPGTYSFSRFMLEPDVHLVAELNGGTPIIVNIQNMFRIADRCTVDLPIGKEYPLSLQFYTAQTEQVFIGNKVVFKGVVCAPEAEISVNSRTKVFGGVYGKKVLIQPNVTLCKPPVLADLYHSEITFAPSFDPLNTFYTSIISQDAATLNVLPTAEDTGITVTVNGNNPAIPVTLSGSSTDITILLTDTDGCSSTRYLLRVQRSPNYMIYVNDDSPCTPGTEDGETWATAWKDLQDALDNAAITGREIWVAEGMYNPTKRIESTDVRSATFLINPGIEIKGGFNGTEPDGVPVGSPYNTLISGDISGNDGSIGVWPPTISDGIYLSDNVYHVVTTNGNSKSIHLYRLVIQGGVANGKGYNKIGAGIFNKNSSPAIEYCGIRQNYSDSSGAGIYDEGGFVSIVSCLFKNNVSLSDNGAGLYNKSRKPIKIDGSVFDGNTTKDSSSLSGGGAIYISGALTEIVNSVFTLNIAKGKGGAIFNNGSILKLVNCTFYNNSATKGAGGINNQLAQSTIVNTILWNNNGEISDTISNVNYSCIRGGYPGNGNISSLPEFTSTINPEGADGKYGTNDDGLRLTGNSPCLDNALTSGAPPVDITGIIRPSGSGVEIGAYEYVDLNRTNKTFLGRMRDGVFYETADIDRILQLSNPAKICKYSKSRYHRVIRA
ncbi:MAG: hypothetical protein GX639_17340, partial [Fibrobacter sp.]|nr:hypothetical protein [Fibrobacter sp.]